ncbi:MAG: hypothetical protein GQ582_05750 [Methyloprofundus sp.]|nr:hypothetical protein [Methyloprofundus sp.]
MSNEVINQVPTVERAKELEQQVKEGLSQLKAGQDKAIAACYKMRDTKAYSALGFDSYHAWGASALKLKKTRLNELALAGEVQQELLMGFAENITPSTTASPSASESIPPIIDSSVAGSEHKELAQQATDILSAPLAQPSFSSAELSDINTPQLIALAKAPKGERLAVLDMAATEAKVEDKPITTNIIKEAVRALAKPIEPTADEQAAAIKKQHKSAMGKVSKLGEELRELETIGLSSEEIADWKAHLDEIKESILLLEKGLGYE